VLRKDDGLKICSFWALPSIHLRESQIVKLEDCKLAGMRLNRWCTEPLDKEPHEAGGGPRARAEARDVE